MKTVVLIPCYNEEKTIVRVIRDFKSELPEAQIIVFDNNSADKSANFAKEEGATVFTVKVRGKGFVVRKMFEVIEADIYILVDGDDTYFAKDVHQLIDPILKDEADMVIGRRAFVSESAMKKINRLGNYLFSNVLNFCFMRNINDVLSGYRVMNKYFVHNTPILTHEFQVEMEMTIQALYRKMRVIEVPVKYKERPEGSLSKLHPLKDGSLILLTLLALVRDLRPLALFGFVAFLLLIGVICYGIFIYLMPREANLLDTIIIISGSIIAFLFLSMGLFLHAINRRFVELHVLLKRGNDYKSH
jgi:glycosyltransferase involved in cell wall biosynthesis